MEILEQGVISHQPGRGAYMPVITPLSDGSYIASQHVGSGLGSPDNHIEVLRSENGRDWIDIHSGAPSDGYCYRGPKISEVPDGRLVMTAGRFEATIETSERT